MQQRNIKNIKPTHEPITHHNALLSFAAPLMLLITQLRHAIEHQDMPKLHAQVIEEIKKFEHKLVRLQYPLRSIIAARYCLCTAIDETVLSKSWGTQSIWVQESLLSLFHKETWGGERFYIILEEMAKDPRKNIDFLEFAYFLLSLGFEGKYFDNNLAIREEIRNRILHLIRYSRQKPEKSLSQTWHHDQPFFEKINRVSKLKKRMILTLLAITSLALLFNYRLYSAANNTLKELSTIATVSPSSAFSQIIDRPIIQQNLMRG